MNNNCSLILKSLLKGNRVLYISVPITSGKRYLEWYSNYGHNLDPDSDEYNAQLKKHVLLPNYESSELIIKGIKNKVSHVVINPSNLENSEMTWSQNDYYDFWDEFISTCVDEILFLDGWEYSIGCCHEFESAIKSKKHILNQAFIPFSLEKGIEKISESYSQYKNINSTNANLLKNILINLEHIGTFRNSSPLDSIRNVTFKDEKLHEIASKKLGNIAQYISFNPAEGLQPHYVHVKNCEKKSSNCIKDYVKLLINSSDSKSVNIRSFSLTEMKGNKLIYGKKIDEVDEIVDFVKLNSMNGKHSIINENIDINDGGVSGVIFGDVIEFSPEDTPKCVDKDLVCSLPRQLGLRMLKMVYGFDPKLDYDPAYRMEFSIHPQKQGLLEEHSIIWEYEYFGNYNYENKIQWPNRFSMFLGDKVFGLLIAELLGFSVPKTTVISRKIAPFTFGKETGFYEKWIRTCPINKEPGKYYTGFGWKDPFELMEIEEKKGSFEKNIASILSQDSVKAHYSGAAFVRLNEKDDLIEGVSGNGDTFMVGERESENLPENVLQEVKLICNLLRNYHNLIGDVSIEWVFDGVEVWIVQMNQLKVELSSNESLSRIIVNGSPKFFEKVYVKDGLENLRQKIESSKKNQSGIDLVGNVGITSHFGDLLRLSGIPSRLINE